MYRIFVALFLVSQAAVCQKISIEGVLTDSSSRPLASATALLLNPADSTLIHFAPSEVDGKFIFRSIRRQPYLLRVSYVGYATFSMLIELDSTSERIILGNLTLVEAARELDEVIVTGQKAPVIIRHDTIEFNADSFRTKENGMVEDLLKKLPGVEVDNDGTIRAQGEAVQRVTVDGRNFFGNDPRLATRNLPADAIDKVQLFDKKSDQAMFTGIDDGQKEKTINLELKEEKRKGAFGQLHGGGSDERFEAKASINQFRRDRQLSFLGMGNNVNEQGFAIDDYMNFTGGSQAMMSGRGAVRLEIGDENQNGVPLNLGNRPDGIMHSYAGGINYNHNPNKKTELTSSYFYNRIDHKISQKLLRENFFSTAKLDYMEVSDQDNTNDNHRLNFSLDQKIDSMNSIKLTSTLSYTETNGILESAAAMTAMNGSIINSSDRSVESDATAIRLTSSLLWRHRFSKKGRTLSGNIQHTGSYGNTSSLQNAAIRNGEEENGFVQSAGQETDNDIISTTVSYTEPLGKRKYLEGNYSYRINRSSFSRNVFDLLENEMLWNDSISAAYSSSYQFHKAGLNMRINRKNFHFTAGASVQDAQLNGLVKQDNTSIIKSFRNVLPVVRLNYQFTNSKDFRVEYETSVQEPSVQQLQPVVDNTDPLNLYVGNPRLRPSFVQNLRVHFSSFDPISFISFFAFVDVRHITDAITVSQTIDKNGARLSMPVNVKDRQSLTSNLSFGFPIEKVKSRVALSTNFRLQHGLTVIDDTHARTRENVISGRVRYDYHLNDVIEAGLMANISRQEADFELGVGQDQLFFNNTYSGDVNLTLPWRFIFNTAFQYLDYSNVSNGFSQTIPLWNLSLSRFILKAKSGEIKLGVNNVLDKNLGISQNTGLNYTERRESNALGRYFMVSFTYSLNKQLNPLALRPRGRVMRIMQ